jgi:four helix bundle suffix protein
MKAAKPRLLSRKPRLSSPAWAAPAKEELLADYRDYLRVRDHAIRDKDSREAMFVRRPGRKTPHTFELYREFVKTRPPEVIANIAICLIHQTNYLIDQQLRRLEKDFLEQGGLCERMFTARLAQRNRPPQK